MCGGADVSLRGLASRRRGRGCAVARYRRDPDAADLPRLLYSPSTTPTTSLYGPDEVGGTSTAADRAAVEETDDEGPGLGRGSKVAGGGGGRRKAAGSSGRLRFQYPDVFGRRRARGGSTTAAGRRRTITSGRMNFRHRTAQAQRDDVTFSDSGDRPEVSLCVC